MKNQFLLSILPLLVIAGCAKTPIGQAFQSRAALVAAEQALVTAREQNLIDDAAYKRIEPARASAAKAQDDLELAARAADNAKDTFFVAQLRIAASMLDAIVAARGQTVASKAGASTRPVKAAVIPITPIVEGTVAIIQAIIELGRAMDRDPSEAEIAALKERQVQVEKRWFELAPGR